MKKIFTILTLFVFILTSCDFKGIDNQENKYPIFKIVQSNVKEVPDSLRKDYQEFINTTIKNTVSNKLIAKDLDDIVSEINDIAFNLYAKHYNCLLIKYSYSESDYDKISVNNLNKEQKIIYDSLVKEQCKPKINKTNFYDLDKGKYVGRNAMIIYISRYKLSKDTLKIQIEKLLAIEDSLEKTYK